jgi:transitional endoplasmic reticulum ATPase
MPITKDLDLSSLATMTKGYSGADIEALCREAALNALRANLKTKKVTSNDFTQAMEKTGPSVSPDMEKWYKNFIRQVRQIKKPTTMVA